MQDILVKLVQVMKIQLEHLSIEVDSIKQRFKKKIVIEPEEEKETGETKAIINDGFDELRKLNKNGDNSPYNIFR